MNLTPTPKIAPKSPKNSKKAEILAESKTNPKGYTSKTKNYSLHVYVFEPALDLKNSAKGQKIAPKGPKKCKRGPKYGCFQNKR